MKKFKFALALLLVGTLVSFAAKAQSAFPEYIPFNEETAIQVDDGVTGSEITDLTNVNKVGSSVFSNPCAGSKYACAWKITLVSGTCTPTTHTTLQKFNAMATYISTHPFSTTQTACGRVIPFSLGTCQYNAELICRSTP